jgi:hypothetical protein
MSTQLADQAAYLRDLPRGTRPGHPLHIPGWTLTRHNVQPHARNTHNEYAHDRVSAYHRGGYVDIYFWGDWDDANRRARELVAAVGPQAHMLYGKGTGRDGRMVRVMLRADMEAERISG